MIILQRYFKDKSIENGLISFRIRTQMLDEIPGNFKNKLKNDKDKFKCNHCEADQIMTHCMDCSAWSDITKDQREMIWLNFSRINWKKGPKVRKKA